MQKLVKKTYKRTTGNDNLHNVANNKTIKMIQFAVSKVFKVRSTTFPYKYFHKET